MLNEVKKLIRELRIPIYRERKRTGVLRTVVARVGYDSQEVQLTFVIAEDNLPQKDQLVARIRKQLPRVTSIAQNINKGETSLILGIARPCCGGRKAGGSAGDVQFSLSPRDFFQLNPEQTIKLYDAVKEAAVLTERELVVDVYCGTGTIALWLAPNAKAVRDIEIIPEAIENARNNASRRSSANAQFYVGQAERLLPEWVRQGLRPDVVVVDPPRTGCVRSRDAFRDPHGQAFALGVRLL